MERDPLRVMYVLTEKLIELDDISSNDEQILKSLGEQHDRLAYLNILLRDKQYHSDNKINKRLTNEEIRNINNVMLKSLNDITGPNNNTKQVKQHDQPHIIVNKMSSPIINFKEIQNANSEKNAAKKTQKVELNRGDGKDGKQKGKSINNQMVKDKDESMRSRVNNLIKHNR